MKLFKLLPVLGLSACASISAATGISQQDVITDATQICAFVPTADTVAQIIAANNPALATAEAIATAICQAVTSKSAKRGATVPLVSGVPVRGQFVR